MLDEPMAGVNPALTQSLLGHIKSLRDEGRTVLFVEHDMDVVHDISDWVIVMAEGRVIAEGPPRLDRHQQRGDRRLPRRPPRHRPRRVRWQLTPLLEATELVAGYIPEVNILNGMRADASRRVSSSASSAPTAPASRRS